MTFITSGQGSGNSGNASLSATKQVIDLSSGNLNWYSSVNASPSDILSFSITLQAIGQQINNVMVRDILPPILFTREI